ncbi:MAG: inositol monophosphatase [Phycisphaeraceae bacterium]|nr:MAG: inositol monophosphatase [Phycisphaeraceae bacterium]
MPEDLIADRLEAALAMAREGGAATLRYFQQDALGIDTKHDGTPVTDADRACETIIRERLAASYPDDGVVGEEFGDAPGSTGFRWIIDPIDGTFSFIHGVPLFTTLIGVEHRGDDGTWRGVAGVIHAPAMDETVYACVGGGAWHAVRGAEPTRARVSKVRSLAEATVGTTALDYWDEATTPVWMRLAAAAKHTRGWPDAYAAILVATGRCDAIVEPSLKCWDVAPFWPIMSEAGGRSTDWHGIETAHSGDVVASNGAIHDEVLRVIRG